MLKNKSFSPERKERIKLIRSILQIIILIILAFFLIKVFFYQETYRPVDEEARAQTDAGFIALSYFGVDRSEENNLINADRLEEHLSALKALGYETISQQDILDYYEQGKKLPEKSLFLMFEDGRKDTAIFSQKVMEKYNYQATIFNYAQNLSINDPKFLRANDLKTLEKTNYWELGSNGNRLAFINVFDRYDNFFDALNTYEFQAVSSYLDGNYNHYLMDYIRDESGIPKETLSQMQKRIAQEYQDMVDIYQESLEEIPLAYVLMHANTGQFGTNDKVSIENERWIKDTYLMNFNREGHSLNGLDDSVFDLTRMQPQAHWYTNHLLMRIQDDIQSKVEFVSGDLEKQADWMTVNGASEFKDDKIILTSEPAKQGLMILDSHSTIKDFSLSVNLEGNQLGEQSLLLRYDEVSGEYITVMVKDNKLLVFDRGDAESNQAIFELDLDHHDGVVKESVKVNELHSLITKLETDLKYANAIDEAQDIRSQLKQKKKELQEASTSDSPDYTPDINQTDTGYRVLELTLNDTELSISIDGKVAVEKLQVQHTSEGTIGLRVMPEINDFNERNQYDDVYDGVFSKIVVGQTKDLNDLEKLYYDNRLHGFEKMTHQVQKLWISVIDWFIENL